MPQTLRSARRAISFSDAASYMSTGAPLYGSEFSLPSTNIAVSWPLRTDALDVSGNGYNGTAIASVSFASANGPGAFTTDTSNDQIRTTSTLSPGGYALVGNLNVSLIVSVYVWVPVSLGTDTGKTHKYAWLIC
ncbi:hypothetical protein T492DRAFT_154740 [Pavlovales sp. CCMP2436]|nr:hypothetical protein T492DRAFT_154740 [Pavlovales sp. CCMP2436]